MGSGDSGKGRRSRTSFPREKVRQAKMAPERPSHFAGTEALQPWQGSVVMSSRKSAIVHSGFTQSRSPADFLRSETNVECVRWHTHKAPSNIWSEMAGPNSRFRCRMHLLMTAPPEPSRTSHRERRSQKLLLDCCWRLPSAS